MPGPARCIRCQYILEGLPEARCPECGQAFNPDDPLTYTTKTPFVWWRYWLPGFLLAVGVGIVTYLILLTAFGYGWAATIVTPLCIGAIIGYACRVRTFFIVLLSLLGIFAVLMGLYSGGLVGILCGLVFGGVAIGPAILGGLFGATLRNQLKRGDFSQRDWLPLVLLSLIPLSWGCMEGRHTYPTETIETSVVIPASVVHAWDGVMFYEEVRHEPPLLLRLLLPRPLYTRGSTEHIGDIKYCIYSKGRLVKKITRREEGRLLAFEVIEQQKIEVRSIRLTSGQFRFDPIGPAQTRITLATDYQPLLGPRFAWRWAEIWATHTLHRHVLAGMEVKAKENESNRIAWR